MENHCAFNSSAVDIKSTGSYMSDLISSEATEGGKLNSTTQSYSLIFLPLIKGLQIRLDGSFCCVVSLFSHHTQLFFSGSDVMPFLFVWRTLFKMTFHARLQPVCSECFWSQGFLFLVF